MAIPLWGDIDAAALRGAARRTRDAAQARCLLALAGGRTMGDADRGGDDGGKRCKFPGPMAAPAPGVAPQAETRGKHGGA